jgi:uncharacterized protein YjbI with pentapeptide repeats
METTIKCGRHLARHADISKSQFQDVNLARAEFDDVNLGEASFNNINLARARFHNINLSDISVSAAQMGGAHFRHIGPPPGPDGKQERQRPVTFEEMMLCDSTFRRVDLSDVRIVECDTTGMTIDGIAVADLLAAYRQQRK